MGTVEAAIAGEQALSPGERMGADDEIGQDPLSRPAALPIRSPRAPRLDRELAIHVVEPDADVLEGSHAVLSIFVRGRHLRPDRGAGDDAALLQASVEGRARCWTETTITSQHIEQDARVDRRDHPLASADPLDVVVHGLA